MLPSRQAEAAFLTQEEKIWITSELVREEEEKIGERSISALHTLAHPRAWHLAAGLLGFDIALYATSFYMPQALKSTSKGCSNTAVDILVMVPALAGLMAMTWYLEVPTADWSDGTTPQFLPSLAAWPWCCWAQRAHLYSQTRFGHLRPWEFTASLAHFSHFRASSLQDSPPPLESP